MSATKEALQQLKAEPPVHPKGLTPHITLVASLLYMMSTDGDLAPEEISRLQESVGLDKEAIPKARAYIKKNKFDAFLKDSCEILDKPSQVCILANVYECMLADGIVQKAETKLFQKIQKAYGFNDKTFEKISSAIDFKNKHEVLGIYDASAAQKHLLTPHLILASSILFMMSADGAVSEEEIGQLSAVINPYEGLQASAMAYVDKTPMGAFIAAAQKSLNSDQKKYILLNVCDSMLADGVAEPREVKIFNELLEAFGISEHAFKPLYSVIHIKNVKPFDTQDSSLEEANGLFKNIINDEGGYKVKSSTDEFSNEKLMHERVIEDDEDGEKIRRTMQENTKNVTEAFSSTENIAHVALNASSIAHEELIHQDRQETNLQKVSSEKGEENVQKISIGDPDVNIQNLHQGQPVENTQKIETSKSNQNVQTLNADRSIDNIQTISKGSPGENTQQIDSDKNSTPVQKLSADASSDNIAKLSGSNALENVQNLANADINKNTQRLSKDKSLENQQKLDHALNEENIQALSNDANEPNSQKIAQDSLGTNRAKVSAPSIDINIQAIGSKNSGSNTVTLTPGSSGVNFVQLTDQPSSLDQKAKPLKDRIQDKTLGEENHVLSNLVKETEASSPLARLKNLSGQLESVNSKLNQLENTDRSLPVPMAPIVSRLNQKLDQETLGNQAKLQGSDAPPNQAALPVDVLKDRFASEQPPAPPKNTLPLQTPGTENNTAKLATASSQDDFQGEHQSSIKDDFKGELKAEFKDEFKGDFEDEFEESFKDDTKDEIADARYNAIESATEDDFKDKPQSSRQESLGLEAYSPGRSRVNSRGHTSTDLDLFKEVLSNDLLGIDSKSQNSSQSAKLLAASSRDQLQSALMLLQTGGTGRDPSTPVVAAHRVSSLELIFKSIKLSLVFAIVFSWHFYPDTGCDMVSCSWSQIGSPVRLDLKPEVVPSKILPSMKFARAKSALRQV